MRRNDVIMWFGRIATAIFTAAVIIDMMSEYSNTREIRASVLVIVGLVVFSILAWQVHAALKYDGLPFIPVSFRWVVAIWFGSLLVFISWSIAITFFSDLYSDLRSSVIWWQFAVGTIWFASRWLTLDFQHKAGPGETGRSQ